METGEKGRLSGLLPIGIFLLLFIGSGLLSGDFYAIPAVAAFLTALAAAFLQNPKRSFEEKLSSVAKSMGEENVMVMCLIFLLAGAFSGAVQAAGGVESTVNFGLSVLPAHVVIAGMFLIACFISVAMGTSVGTIAALTPIAAGISEKTGFAGALCISAVVSGAMFGDNLSVISDTTIAAARTQGCRMKDKFKENLSIVTPAAILTVIVFFILGFNGDYTADRNLEYSFTKLLPYLLVLFCALAGLNVFAVLILGTVVSLLIGVITGSVAFSEIFLVIAQGADGSGGIKNMYDIAVISLIAAGLIGLVKDNGGIDFILEQIKKRVKSRRGAELGIAALSSLVDASTANNTVAIVMAGPIAKDIAAEYGITPKRTAALLDIFTSGWQGLLPYGAQLLYASAGAAAMGLSIPPAEFLPYSCYPVLMMLCAIFYIIRKDRD